MQDEPMDNFFDTGLELDDDVRRNFLAIGKWTKALAVIIFVVCGIVALILTFAGTYILNFIGLLASTSISMYIGAGAGLLIGIFIVCLLICVVFYYFLFRFSIKIKSALFSEDEHVFQEGIRSLKIYFVISSILSILGLLNTLMQLFKF